MQGVPHPNNPFLKWRQTPALAFDGNSVAKAAMSVTDSAADRSVPAFIMSSRLVVRMIDAAPAPHLS
jgi:hypothetical protein